MSETRAAEQIWDEAIEKAAEFLEGDAILHDNDDLRHEANLIRFYLKHVPPNPLPSPLIAIQAETTGK